MKIACGFIRANWSAPNRPALPGLPSTCRLTTSDWANSSSAADPTGVAVGQPVGGVVEDHPQADGLADVGQLRADVAVADDGSACGRGSRGCPGRLFHTPSCIRWDLSGSLRANAMISASTSSTTLRVLENGALKTATPRSGRMAEVDLVGPDAEAPDRQQVLPASSTCGVMVVVGGSPSTDTPASRSDSSSSLSEPGARRPRRPRSERLGCDGWMFSSRTTFTGPNQRPAPTSGGGGQVAQYSEPLVASKVAAAWGTWLGTTRTWTTPSTTRRVAIRIKPGAASRRGSSSSRSTPTPTTRRACPTWRCRRWISTRARRRVRKPRSPSASPISPPTSWTTHLAHRGCRSSSATRRADPGGGKARPVTRGTPAWTRSSPATAERAGHRPGHRGEARRGGRHRRGDGRQRGHGEGDRGGDRRGRDRVPTSRRARTSRRWWRRCAASSAGSTCS